MKKVIVILGPTATGKTDIALELAKKFNGELISCDSRQVYKSLDIGTGKLPTSSVILSPLTEYGVNSAKNLIKGEGFWEMDGVKVWMLDIADPKKRYTVFDYINDAEKVLEDIFKREKLPIIVGGTGFYLKALLEGLDNLIIPRDKKLRIRLEKLSISKLQEEFKKISGAKFEKLNNSDRNNPRRLIRAIELLSQKPNKKNVDAKSKDLDVLKIGLTTRREIIGKRIRDRILHRLDKGMIEEVTNLLKNGLSIVRLKELGLEYSIISDYVSGVIKNKEDLVKILRIKIGQYAKRQMTWFKKEKDVNWFDITEKNYHEMVEKMVTDWYNLGHAS